MQADYKDRVRMAENFHEELRVLQELQELLDRQSSDSTSPEGGDVSESFEDMIQESLASIVPDELALFKRSMQARHDASFDSPQVSSKATLECARANWVAYEKAVLDRDQAKADINKLSQLESYQRFLGTVEDKAFGFPFPENEYLALARNIGFSLEDQEYYSLICEENKISTLFKKNEKKLRLNNLVSIVRSRIDNSHFPVKRMHDLVLIVSHCEQIIRSFKDSKDKVQLHEKILSLVLLREISDCQNKMNNINTLHDALNMPAIFNGLDAALARQVNSRREWPANKASSDMLMDEIAVNKRLLSEATPKLALAKDYLNQIRSAQVLLTSIENEYKDCNLKVITELDYKALYTQWHAAKAIPEHCGSIIENCEVNTIPQLNAVVATDENLLAEYQRRASLLENFEGRIASYIEGRKLRKMPVSITSIFHKDTGERIPYMTELLAMLTTFSQDHEMRIDAIKSKIQDVLDNPNKFLTSKVGEGYKGTLRGILEDLLAEIRALYPEVLSVDNFELMDITPEDSDEKDQLGDDFTFEL